MSLKVGCVTLGRNCSLSHDMKACEIIKQRNGAKIYDTCAPIYGAYRNQSAPKNVSVEVCRVAEQDKLFTNTFTKYFLGNRAASCLMSIKVGFKFELL